MTGSWGWRRERSLGIWQYGLGWLKPLVAVAPYLCLMIALLMLYFIGGTFTATNGVVFELPEAPLVEGEKADLTALIIPRNHDTVIFFDDTRYLMGDAGSMRSLGARMAELSALSPTKTMLVLADRRISTGELVQFSEFAKNGGIRKLLFAGKRAEDVAE